MKGQANMTTSMEINETRATDPREKEIHELLNKELKIIVLSSVSYKWTQWNEIREVIHKQNLKFNKEIENKKTQAEILALKNKITKLKNSIETFNSITDHSGERISKLKDRAFEVIWLEEPKEKKESESEKMLKWLME